MQLRWSGHLMRMDDERLLKRLFYGDFATGTRRQGGQKRRYKDTLKIYLKELQINPSTWEFLAQDRPAWRRSMKNGAAIYEANRIMAAKGRRAARKSQTPRINTTNTQALPTCPRCQYMFRARIGLVRHLRRPHPNIHQLLPPPPQPPPHSQPPPPPSPPPPPAMGTLIICPYCDRTYTSRIGLIGHLRINRAETGELVPGAPTQQRSPPPLPSLSSRIHSPHGPSQSHVHP
ncbi:unnamed protein product [Schistocephalus solidus]|uniref:C2H2-type domain-containing protein n=1 Tax=Schistocephalus solidus TaxID=70667 RepID=A0A183SHZ1_SCHSO|nr:unnamed protein product [Schistocephalus solidus]